MQPGGCRGRYRRGGVAYLRCLPALGNAIRRDKKSGRYCEKSPGRAYPPDRHNAVEVLVTEKVKNEKGPMFDASQIVYGYDQSRLIDPTKVVRLPCKRGSVASLMITTQRLWR